MNNENECGECKERARVQRQRALREEQWSRQDRLRREYRRDQFAVSAMRVLMAELPDMSFAQIAVRAVQMADLMLGTLANVE